MGPGNLTLTVTANGTLQPKQSVNIGSDSTRLKVGIRQLLRERRKLADGDEDNFNIFGTRQIA